MKRVIRATWYFGEEEYNKYGKEVREALGGKTVSKAISKANDPGGLCYEADNLNMDKFALLRTLEGLCANGEAEEIDDSTYYVESL